MTGPSTSWTVTLARHQAPLDAALVALAHAYADDPAAFVVVTRSRETEDRLRRMLPVPTQVSRLAEFLGAVAATPSTAEDLLPDEVVHGHLVDALPAALKSSRDAVADDHLRTIQTLATNGIRPPYPGTASDPAEDLVEASHRALLKALVPYNQAGRFAAFQRVLLAHHGAPRLHQRFPGLQTVVLSGIDWLSPAEERALEHVLLEHVHVHVHAIGRPPRTRETPIDGPEGIDAQWAALRHTDRLVRWAAHWRTAPIDDRHEPEASDARVSRLDTLYALYPHDRRPLPDVHLERPPDPDHEVQTTAARIHDLLDDQSDDDPGRVRPEDIAIIVPRLERYAEPLRDALDAHGISHTIRHGPPLATTAPGTLLRLIQLDLDHAHERDRLLELVAHPLFRYVHEAPDGTTTAIVAPWIRKVLARRGLSPRGTNGWRHAFERLVASQGDLLGGARPTPAGDDADDSEDGLQAPDFLHRQRDAVLHLIERLDALAAADDAETFFTRLRDLLQHIGVGRTLRRAMRHSDDPRGLSRAFDAVLDLLDETQRAYRLRGRRTTSSQVREMLMRRLHATPLPVTTDRAWGVQVIGLRNAAGTRFRQVHLLGATADDLPPLPRPRRLERLLERRLGRDRLRRLDPDLEARRIVHGLLADTDGPVFLSASKEVDGTPQAPSVLLQEIEDLFVLDAAPPVASRLRTPLDLHKEAARWHAVWEGAPEHLTAARTLLHARNDATDTGPYTGHLVDAHVQARLASRTLAGGEAVSSTRLNRYARCPQHALWGDLARLRGDEERDGDISPLDKGKIVHAVLDRWSRDLIARHGAPARVGDIDDESRRLAAIATELIGGLHLEGLGWTAYKEELLGGLGGTHPYTQSPRGLLRRFLDDMVRRDVAVLATEVSFGDERDPVVIGTNGHQVKVRGTIDRIEVLDEGLQVLDIKTGNPPKRRDTAGGLDLQVPLYVLATQRLFADRPVRLGGYYQLKRARSQDTGLAEQIPGPKEGPETLQRLIERTPERVHEIVEAQRDGHHPLTLLDQTDAKCGYCDHRLLCGRRPHLTARRREAARDLGPAWGYVPDHIHDLLAIPEDATDDPEDET